MFIIIFQVDVEGVVAAGRGTSRDWPAGLAAAFASADRRRQQQPPRGLRRVRAKVTPPLPCRLFVFQISKILYHLALIIS